MAANKPSKEAILAAFFDEGNYSPLFTDGAVSAAFGCANGQSVYAVYQNGEPVGAADLDKTTRVLKMAAETGNPVVTFYNSTGAKLEGGLELLNANSRLTAEIARISGVVPQVAVVTGTCAGTNAINAASADLCIMAEDAELFLNAPFNTPDGKLEGAGKAANAAKSGVADILAKDDAEAIAKAKKLAAILPANNISLAGNDDFAENDAAVSASMKGADLVAALADKNSTVELGAEFGTAAYTAFASVNWASVAFVATDKAAKLTAADCAKIARFVQLADVFSIPVVTVVNTEGFEASSAAELAGSVRDAAKLAQVYASATTTKINLITGKAIGAAYTAFDSADISYAWEKAVIAPMNPEAVKVFMGEEADTTPFKAASLGMIDGVIAAEDTKQAVASAVDLCSSKRVAAPTRKHVNFVF